VAALTKSSHGLMLEYSTISNMIGKVFFLLIAHVSASSSIRNFTRCPPDTESMAGRKDRSSARQMVEGPTNATGLHIPVG
jgi:hypothetical protein